MGELLFALSAGLAASVIATYISKIISNRAKQKLEKQIKVNGHSVNINIGNIKDSLHGIEKTIEEIKKNPRVFISYSHKNKDIAKKLHSDLSEYDLDIFLDEASIEVGQSISSRIDEMISDSNWVIPIISSDFMSSKWAGHELDKAKELEFKRRSRLILPVVYGETEVPEFIKDRLYVDVKNNYEEAVLKIVKSIRNEHVHKNASNNGN